MEAEIVHVKVAAAVGAGGTVGYQAVKELVRGIESAVVDAGVG